MATITSHESTKVSVLARACEELSANRREAAAAIIAAEYPLDLGWNRPGSVVLAPTGALSAVPAPDPATVFARSGPRRDLAAFVRDGFTDRYTGGRVVFIPALHLISAELPAVLPRHPNWKVGACHQAYWELAASVDHWNPFAKSEDLTNIVTANEVTNEIKGRRSATELGWGLCPEGSIAAWDGLLRWFVAYFGSRRTHFAQLSTAAKWFGPAREAIQSLPIRRFSA